MVLYNFLCGPCVLGILLDHFTHTPSIIGVSATGLTMETYALIGGHQHFAYVPLFMLPYDSDMDFWQRFYNFFAYIYAMRFVLFMAILN